MVRWHGPMTMSMTHGLLLSSTIIFFTLLVSSSCLQTLPISASQPQGMLVEDKVRLGSTPPSCHNRCNECNPCRPVQVPTRPTGTSTSRIRARARARPVLVDQPAFNQYSNYKPLGWKCRCGDRLFNP